MKILEINKFNHVRGGADKHFVELVKLLEQKGNEVAVFSMYHPENLESSWSKYFVSQVDYENGSWFNKLKGVLRIFWSLEARRKISKLLDEFQPDVVHIHNIYHQISPSILPEIKKRKIPIVMTVHDWKLICPNYLLNCRSCPKAQFSEFRKLSFREKNYWKCARNKCVKNSYIKSLICALEMYFHKWLKIYEKNINLYIAPSQFVKDVLVQAGFAEGKIRVLPHFVGVGHLQKAPGPGEDYALYFGRVSKEKGVDELVEIFENLPFQLILAGNRDKNFEIPSYPNVKYVGFKNSHELESLIWNCKFVVSASRLPETFGFVALESVKNGKPFVGYGTGAYGEIIENGINGYLAKDRREFVDKIIEYAAAKIPKFEFEAEKFNPQRYYQKIIDIFHAIC